MLQKPVPWVALTVTASADLAGRLIAASMPAVATPTQQWHRKSLRLAQGAIERVESCRCLCLLVMPRPLLLSFDGHL
jgi:hypothetical protein